MLESVLYQIILFVLLIPVWKFVNKIPTMPLDSYWEYRRKSRIG
jgi:hypothetical protein